MENRMQLKNIQFDLEQWVISGMTKYKHAHLSPCFRFLKHNTLTEYFNCFNGKIKKIWIMRGMRKNTNYAEKILLCAAKHPKQKKALPVLWGKLCLCSFPHTPEPGLALLPRCMPCFTHSPDNICTSSPFVISWWPVKWHLRLLQSYCCGCSQLTCFPTLCYLSRWKCLLLSQLKGILSYTVSSQLW